MSTHAFALVLAENQVLRFITFALLYACQGVPIGLTLVAIPAWMAGNGKSASEIAVVTSTALLPWGLKMFNGLIMEHYAFLAMGRRRAWLVGAQAVICVTLLCMILLRPGIDDTAVMIAVLVVMHTAVTFQDAAIDGIVIDVTPRAEFGRVNSFMGAGQVIGSAASGAVAGAMLNAYGLAGAVTPLLLFVGAVLVLVCVVVERRGERRLPWSPGQAAERVAGTTAMAWRTLLRRVVKALLHWHVAIFLVSFLCYGIAFAIFDIGAPIFATQMLGRSAEETSSLISLAGLLSGCCAVILIGPLVDRFGSKLAGALGYVLMGFGALTFTLLLPPGWQDTLFAGFIFFMFVTGQTVAIASIALAMRMCQVDVAASQFALMMAVSNIARVVMQNGVSPLLERGGFTLVWLTVLATALLGAAMLYWSAFLLPRQRD